MEENKNISEAVSEIRNATEEELRELIEKWFESTRTDGMKIGAYFISAAVYDAVQKNLKDGMSSSHRDFQRAVRRVIEIVSVQLTQHEAQQNNLEKSDNSSKEDNANGKS